MGCSSLPFSSSPQQDASDQLSGITPGNQPDENPGYNNFDLIISDISKTEFTENINISANSTLENKILYIQAEGVDTTGNATRWIVAVQHTNTTSLVTYDHNGRSIVNWPGRFSGPVIQTDQIVDPRKLVDDNRDLIFGDRITNETLPRRLVLNDGNYTLTQSGQGASRILIFNATTGVLISSHE